MSKQKHKSGSELFIVDNSDQDWKVVNYLHDWCDLSKSIDVASGYFEIGALLALDKEWQKIDQIRILMGDEVSKRTKSVFIQGLTNIKDRLDSSIEKEKLTNDFLEGVPAIVDAIRSGKVQCRVYRKGKFHAKTYITHARHEVIGAAALVGSSNFTLPGLSKNIELNVQITGKPVSVLQDWYEEYWNQAEDVTPDLLKTIERHTTDYSPFIVYAKALQEYFRGHLMSATEWERDKSKVYSILAQYQRDGYHALLKKAKRYNGAFLCDGVGLGKTFIGLMIIERMVEFERQRVALFVPKAARESVWESTLETYAPHVFGAFSNLEIYNHTDLLRKGDFARQLKDVQDRADVIIIDEGHNFRNTRTHGKEVDGYRSRYWRMFDITKGKKVFLLTATPVNNRLTDFQHMIELFSQKQSDYFKDAPLGINSLAGHFRRMEKALERMISEDKVDGQTLELNLADAEQLLSRDILFQELVEQRSRAYVKKSLENNETDVVLFPVRHPPQVAPYSIKKTYGELLRIIEKAFNKETSLFSLPVYFPYAFYKGDESEIPALEFGRRKQVVTLIRTGFLKRFESSANAFEMSCWNLLRKLLAFCEVHAETVSEVRVLERWKIQHDELIGYVHSKQTELFRDEDEDEIDEDILPQEMLDAVERLDRSKFRVSDIIMETIQDLTQLAEFMNELKRFKPIHDDKLKALIRLLKTDPVLKKQKVLIFTEFMATARYLQKELKKAGIKGVEEVDSARASADKRGGYIRRFAPYYNGLSSDELSEKGLTEARIMISTDVLSEGLNLQDATRLINYDLHWNPVRLMQRIGRIDRRLNPDIEARIIADHPDQKKVRGEIRYWNFLPPSELDRLLRLYSKVSHKTLRISKTLGIEGRKLLRPDDQYDDLKNFNEAYEGTTTPIEDMNLDLQRLLKDDPELEKRLNHLPGRVFSGKAHPTPGAQAVFFCYALPGKEVRESTDQRETEWSIEAGPAKWYVYDIARREIIEDATEIYDMIKSKPETPRKCAIPRERLIEIRIKIDKHIHTTYLKKVMAPVGVEPVLKAWMELS